eukprot:SAG31_NODE_1566_length_7856_cov_8.045607_9_plen_162_part_00
MWPCATRRGVWVPPSQVMMGARGRRGAAVRRRGLRLRATRLRACPSAETTRTNDMAAPVLALLLLLLLVASTTSAHPTGFAPGWNGKARRPPMGAADLRSRAAIDTATVIMHSIVFEYSQRWPLENDNGATTVITLAAMAALSPGHYRPPDGTALSDRQLA